jgi:TolA-binding protein
MTEPKGLSMKEMAERFEALEQEVNELRDLIQVSNRQNTEANRQTRQAVGGIASRGPKSLRG